MSERKRMLELAGVEEKPRLDEALTPAEIKKSFDRYNKNLQRLTLTDSFFDAVMVAIPYAMNVAGKTIETLDEDDIELFSNMLARKFGINIEQGGKKEVEINKSFASKVKNKLKKIQKKFKVDKGSEENYYDLWKKGKLRGF